MDLVNTMNSSSRRIYLTYMKHMYYTLFIRNQNDVISMSLRSFMPKTWWKPVGLISFQCISLISPAVFVRSSWNFTRNRSRPPSPGIRCDIRRTLTSWIPGTPTFSWSSASNVFIKHICRFGTSHGICLVCCDSSLNTISGVQGL